MVARGEMQRRFGRVLRERRLATGLSQEALAYAAELTRNYVSELERGLKSPSLGAISALASALGVAAHDLIRSAEEPAEPEIEVGGR